MSENRRSCKAKNALGESCRMDSHLVNQATGFCAAHEPGGQQEMSRRAKLGGAATKEVWRRKGLTEKELGPLETVADSQRWLRIIGAAVVTGRLDKGDAAAATRCVDVWLKGQDSLTEAEVERLADKLEELGKRPKLRQIR